MKDPVHGWINIEDIRKIVDNPLFQRLGYIKQLSSTHYAFPGAKHTRKEHCLGAMHLAEKYMNVLSNSANIIVKPELVFCVKIAALLHDIAHGPYSHSFDSTVYKKIYKVHKGHDQHRYVLLDYFDLTIKQKNIIKSIWRNETKWLSGIIQGVVGVDRLDFSKRDAFYTGTSYGCFDLEGIIHSSSFEIIDNQIKLVYDSKIVKRVIQGLYTRLCMYEEVYLHKTSIAATILIEAMMNESSKYINYENRCLDIGKFVFLNDSTVFSEIMFSTSDNLSKAKEYAQRLYLRKLPKLINHKKIKGKNENVGIEFLDQNTVRWRSRTLSEDFIKEFEKYDIHIKDKDDIISFREYCKKEDIKISSEEYYFERIYKL